MISSPDNFGEGYYNDNQGTGLGRCFYSWDLPATQNWLQREYNFFHDHFKDKGIKRVLLAGCAIGLEVRYLRERGYEAYGTDISPYAIEHAEPAAKEFCQVADIAAMPHIETGSYDAVLSYNVIALLQPELREAAMSELQRVTKDWMLTVFSVRPWFMLPTAEKPDCYDGNPVWLEPLEYWVKLVESQHKFYLDFVSVYHGGYSAWCIWKRGDYRDLIQYKGRTL